MDRRLPAPVTGDSWRPETFVAQTQPTTVRDVAFFGACARVLRESVASVGQASVLPARLGGEELALVTYGLSQAEFHSLLEEVRAAISRIRAPEAPELYLTVSIGWTRVDTGHPLSDAFRRADQALYQAKSEGRNRVLSAPLELAG